MADLFDRLQQHLGTAFRLVEELGGGGMSRVFLADDLELGRKVVIKVLPPEMAAGVNKERFQREIKLAASLQHPHVVPLLITGSSDDLLFYVMPYIEGESLRARLGREGELPVGETVRILREVVDALAYAHDHEVVHRDIKPDNILLSAGHAVVTDFGVAKAVSASSGGTASSLTSLGVALGTPAYMSPEQAAADPHVDHRADIYAVGAMAYEMLTGRPPFTGSTPQQVLAAHVSRPPEPVTQHRSSIPPAMAELIMRCLSKRAADRYQSATEVRTRLDEMATPPSGGITPTDTRPVRAVANTAAHHPVRVAALFGVAAALVLVLVYGLMIALGLPDWVFVAAIALLVVGLPIVLATGHRERGRVAAATTGLQVTTPVGLDRHLTWKKSLTGGGLAFAGLAVLAGGYMAMRSLGIGPVGTLMASGVMGTRELLILADFDSRTADTTLGSTVTELLRISLSESPVLRIADPARVGESLTRMRRAPDTRIDESLAREIAEREGLKAILAGEIATLGSGYVVSARLVAADGTVLTAQQASASDAGELIGAVDDLADRLRERIGESLRSIRRDLPLEMVSTGSLDALRLYAQATRAEIAGDDDRATSLLEQAVAIDSGFAMAYRKLGTIMANNFEQRARRNEVLTRAYELRDRLTPVERGYVVAQYHTDVTGRRDEALAAYRTILDRYPDDHRALNNTGVLYAQLGQQDRSLDFYERALAVDSTWSPGFVNVAFQQQRLGRLDEAARTLTAAERLFPDNPGLRRARVFLAVVRRDYDSAAVIATELLADQRGNLFWEGETNGFLANMAGLRGRLRRGEAYHRAQIAALEERGLAGERLAQDVVWKTVRLLAGESVTLDPDVDSVMTALPVADRPYEDMIRFSALAGDTARAGDLLRDMDQSGQPLLGRDFERAFARSTGEVDLAEGRIASGLAAVREGTDGFGCEPCVAFIRAGAYDRAGDADSSLHYWQQLVDFRWGLPALEAPAKPMALRRLGELYEERGNRERAVQYYNEFVELWKDADPELQPVVSDIRARIGNLVAEGR